MAALAAVAEGKRASVMTSSVAGLTTTSRDVPASCEGYTAGHKMAPQTLAATQLPSHAAAPTEQDNLSLALTGSGPRPETICKACLAIGTLPSPKLTHGTLPAAHTQGMASGSAELQCAGDAFTTAPPFHLCGASDCQRPVRHAHAVQACAGHVCHSGVGVDHEPITAGRQAAENFV